MTQVDFSVLSIAQRNRLEKISRNVAKFDDGTPARRVNWWRKQATEFASNNDLSHDAVFEHVGLTRRVLATRGGRRATAGRKARHWPSALCCVDEKGPIVGPALFGIEFALIVRAAADAAANDAKATFEHWASKAQNARRTGCAPTWSAYRHALTRAKKAEASQADWLRQHRAAARKRLGIDPRTGRLLQPNHCR